MSSRKNLLAVVVASLALGASSTAQLSSGGSDARTNLLAARAAAAPDAFQEEVTVASTGLVLTNTQQLRSHTFQGHDLSLAKSGGTAAAGGGLSILYAPSEGDDAGYRAAISAAAGGATVDYFDGTSGTPSVATMLQYDAVYAWANFAFADSTTYGNNLAAYNDAGGTVVLGVFCTFTQGNSMSGAIMGSGYCPVVSPTGGNFFSGSPYVGDGTTCVYSGVANLNSGFRDQIAPQGLGVEDGFTADGAICHAWRGKNGSGQGDVIYSNGSGAFQLGALQDWGTAVGNAAVCGITAAWNDEGFALAGVSGDPLLCGAGNLVFGTNNIVDLSNAAPSSLSAILASTTSSPTAFAGGTLVPGPSLIVRFVNTDSSGGWSLTFRAPTSISGVEVYAQVGIVDGGAVLGTALSNAVRGVTP